MSIKYLVIDTEGNTVSEILGEAYEKTSMRNGYYEFQSVTYSLVLLLIEISKIDLKNLTIIWKGRWAI